MKISALLAPLAAGLLALFAAALAPAQEGHPMVGSWVGDWGLEGQDRQRVVVILEWTGDELAGTINPGPNAVPIRVAEANPADWSLHMEAEGRDASGRSVPWVIDGRIDDLGTYNRTIAGTWVAGGRRGDFSITRQ